MFDFEKPEVYKKAKLFNSAVSLYLFDQKVIDKERFKEFYAMLEEISKMLYALIRTLS